MDAVQAYKVAKRKFGGGGVFRVANGTVPITGFPSLIGRVGVLYRYLCCGNIDVIPVPAGFRRNLVGKTLTNIFYCDIAEIRFLSKLYHTDIFINQRIECYVNITINRGPLTPHNMPYATMAMLYPQNDDRIVAIDYVTSIYPMYWLRRDLIEDCSSAADADL